MERLLKDYLIERTSEKDKHFSLVCTICGETWNSDSRAKDDVSPAAGSEAAAKEAAVHNHICPFCGKPVCAKCFVKVDNISLCAHCAEDLLKRLEDK